MIKIALCDDDLSALKEIRALIEQYGTERNQKIVCVDFGSPLDLLIEIEMGMRPDILFLDILMPGENGINVAKEIRQYDDAVKIIFLTSSSEFAVESYTVGAYYYQVKPVCEEIFFGLMDAVIPECRKLQQGSLLMRSKNGITRIDLRKLEYCEVVGRTLLFHMENERLLKGIGSLDELCNKLMPYENFLRPHRSFVVNMEYIQRISYKAVTMDDLTEIPIPHGKYSEIKKRYLEYAFSGKRGYIS